MLYYNLYYQLTSNSNLEHQKYKPIIYDYDYNIYVFFSFLHII